MLKLSRRAMLASAVAALAIPAFAQSGDQVLPGFDEALATGGPILIHVPAPWCEACQVQKPIVQSLLDSPDFAPMKKFDVDFDTQKEVLRRHNVQQQSTMIVFKDGKEIDRQVGETDPAVIEALLREAL